MKIKKLHATFGCLRDASLELHDGLNVIYAPNESGKSTWCAFISSMLYGIDTTQREKAGVKPDKIKFQPWSGASMSGEMEIEKDGVDLTVTRRTRLPSAPMRELSVTYTGTAQSIPELQNADMGEMLTGMTRQVFTSSAFVRQNGIAVGQSPELERRIAAMASTGEEGASYSEAENRLRTWQRKRLFNKRGAIPELDRRIQELQHQLEDSNVTMQEQQRLKDELARLKSESGYELTEAERTTGKRREELLAELAGARKNLDECRRAEFRDDADLARRHSKLARSPFGDVSLAQAKAMAVKDIENYKALGTISSAPLLILLVLGLLAIAVGAVMDNFMPFVRIAVAALGVALVVVWAVGTVLMGRIRRDREAQRSEILQHYGLNDISQLSDLLVYHRRLYEDCQRAEELLAADKERTALAEEALSLAESTAVMGKDEEADDEIRKQVEFYATRIANLEGRMSALGDPVVTASLIEEAKAKRSALQAQYDAIGLASETLAAANDELQQRFSPALGRKTAEYMSRLTDGRYDRVSLDRELNANLRRSGDVGDRELAYLSTGATDQLYLAMRLALCDLAMGDESCPLILDDVMVNFDDQRMEKAMDLLSEIGTKRQVILFTCHSREQHYLNGKH